MNPAPFSWGPNWKKPEGKDVCEVCGGLNPWGFPFRMCSTCVGHEPEYCEVVIESEGFEQGQPERIPMKKSFSENSGETANPRWYTCGKELIVAPWRIGFTHGKGSW